MHIDAIHVPADFMSIWTKLLARKTMKPVLYVSYIGELIHHYAK